MELGTTCSGPARATTRLIAGPGNNVLIGGWGADRLYGGNGNDVLVSGPINPASPLNRPGELASLARQWAASSTSLRFRTSSHSDAEARPCKMMAQPTRCGEDRVWNLFLKGKNAVVEHPTRRDVVIPVTSQSGTGRSITHVQRAHPVTAKVSTVKTTASRVVRVLHSTSQQSPGRRCTRLGPLRGRYTSASGSFLICFPARSSTQPSTTIIRARARKRTIELPSSLPNPVPSR